MTSAFDPASFTNLTVTEANDTKLIPVPVGEYTALAEKVEITPWQSKDGTKSGLKAIVTWNVDDAKVKAETQRDKNTVRQDIMLDLTDTNPPGLDMGKGKNIGLGRLREALGLNTPGQGFSFSMVQGRAAKVTVMHEPNEQNPDNGPYVRVKGVAKLS